MKKMLFTVLALAAFCACSKDTERPNITPDEPSGTNVVAISFDADKDHSTRAFFDPTSTAESWEKSLSSITVLVFGSDGGLRVQRNFNTVEVTAKTAVFSIPEALSGQSCDFYVVANYPVTAAVADKPALLALLDHAPGDCNGSFAEVSTSSKRAAGFIMSGNTTKTLGAAGTKTDVAVTLRRNVAKIAVQAATTPEFSNRYLGTVRINSATLTRAASQGYIVAQGAISPGAMNFSHAQPTIEAAGKFNNLFYVYENETLSAGSRLLLTLSATYDRDGNFATLSDQANVTYNVELTGGGSGQFDRNGYYRVQVQIDGLTGSDASATISVAEWEVPATQTVSLGE